jgi:NAD dependent epimerase/dehydratase family enzyme|tara:strand:- start:721 stop:903 length:183 start_codon:yes stop_codon:yes gene_type:complete
MKILITGDFGFIAFIGSNLAQKFEKEQYQLIILTKIFTKKKKKYSKIFKNILKKLMSKIF